MTWIVAAFGALVAGLGILGIIRPRALIGLVESAWKTPAGLYIAVVMRLILGVLLLLVADESHFPLVLRILGVLSLAAAIAVPIVGYRRARAFIGWWTERSPNFIRAWSLVALAFGAFLVYAVV